MQSYGALEQVFPGLYCRTGEWYGSPFRRRMTVARLADGKLWVHNPFELEKADIEALRKLGEVAFVISPNTLHDSDLAAFLMRLNGIDERSGPSVLMASRISS